MFRNISLHVQVAALLAVAVSPIGAVGIWQAVATSQEAARLSEDALINRTRLAAEEERAALTAAFGATEGLAAAVSSASPEQDRCPGLMRRFVVSDPRYMFAGVIDPTGKVTCSSTADGKVPEFVAAVLQDMKDQEPRKRVSLFKRGLSLDSVALTILNPIYRDGGLAATVAVSLPNSLIRAVAVSTDDDAGFRLALMDDRGRIFAEDTEQAGDALWTPQKLADQQDDLNAEHIITRISRAGEQRSYAIVPIFAGDIFALGSWLDRDLDEAATRRIWNAVLFPASMWILALGVSYFAVYRLAVRHITYLRRIVRAFQGGRRKVRAIKLGDAASELVDLGRAFDQMAETIERDEQELRRGIDEKNTLLKEVYHRVKNNLQLVISMMNLQMRRSQSDEAKRAIMRLQERVMGLATVHQRLYQATDLTKVRCDELLSEITANIVKTDATRASITVDFETSPLLLAPDQAIPLSLFATECVMNVVKHVGSAGGKLVVSLREVGEDKVRLSVSNTVAAYSADEALTPGLGTQLIEAFGQQLRGEVEIDRSPGWHRVSLTFPLAA